MLPRYEKVAHSLRQFGYDNDAIWGQVMDWNRWSTLLSPRPVVIATRPSVRPHRTHQAAAQPPASHTGNGHPE